MILKKTGFTLLEILVAVAALSILASIVIVAINPSKQLAAARNSRRATDVATIAQGLYQYVLDHDGALPANIDTSTRMIGTAKSGCALLCGAVAGSGAGATPFTSVDSDKTQFDLGAYANTRYSGSGSWVELANAATKTGAYISPVKDSGNPSTSWINALWISQSPASKPLPNSGQSDSGYQSGGVNMANNVLLLHFDEAIGATSYADGSGNGYGAVCGPNGPVCPVAGGAGKFGSSVSFNGANSTYVSVPDQAALDYTGGNMTISLWVNLTSKASQYFLSKPWNGSGEYSYMFYTNGSGGVVLYTSAGATSSYTLSTSKTITTGSWIHLAATLSSSHQEKIYINGALVTTGTSTVTNWTPSKGDQHKALAIGALYPYPAAQAVSRVNGQMDEVAIFSRALSDAEIDNLYKRGVIKMRFQFRSCSDSMCSGASFVGPDGTATSYFSETTNYASAPASFSLGGISANQYIQYKAFFDNDDGASSPQLAAVTLNGSIPPPAVANGTATTTLDACVDLGPVLVSDYVANIPYDSKYGSAEKTYYAVGKDNKGMISVTACGAENGSSIQIKL